MDRRLKERLVGAGILVIIAVLFVPELLSGPPTPVTSAPAELPNEVPTSTAAAVRTYTVDLNKPGAVSAATRPSYEPKSPPSAPATASVPRAAPAPAAREATPPARPPAPLESAAARPQIQVLPAVPPMAASAASAEPGASNAQAPRKANSFAPIGAKGGWSIQLGSFSSAANAEKLARNLRSKGIRVYVSTQGNKRRVRAGPFPDRAAAERAAAKLSAQGQAVSIIAP